MIPGPEDLSDPWIADAAHRAFLIRDAHRALDLFDASLRPGGGVQVLDLAGTPLPGSLQELHTTTRLVHSYALAQMAGRPDRAGLIDRGMDELWTRHRDRRHGGYLWSLDQAGVVDGTKLAYGHVFVLLAASSAKLAGHPDADRLLADICEVLETRFWDEASGLFRDEFTRDWQVFSTYRGMNANMHGVEALLAAHEATGEALFLQRAGRILAFFIAGQAARHGWRIPEHYDESWRPDPDYRGNPVFRPPGTRRATASRWRACCCSGGIWRAAPAMRRLATSGRWSAPRWTMPGTRNAGGWPIRCATARWTMPHATGGRSPRRSGRWRP